MKLWVYVPALAAFPLILAIPQTTTPPATGTKAPVKKAATKTGTKTGAKRTTTKRPIAKKAPPPVESPLETQVLAELKDFDAKVNIYAKNLDTGKTFSVAGDSLVRTASTIKLAVLAAAYQAAAEGKLNWDDRVTLKDEDKVQGAGILPEFSAGDTMTVRTLSHLMIVLSDNTATNLMIDKVGGDYVNEWADKAGLLHTRVLRKIGGASPTKASQEPIYASSGLGASTPHEMVRLIEKMERGEAVSPEASKEMIAVLKRQQDHNGIPRLLGMVDVANKSGALDHLRSDVGIVYSKNGRIAMAITCDDIPDVDWSPDNPGYLKISKLAAMLVLGLETPR